MLLRDVCEGRDNNFNLIRMIAAVAVLVSHSWPLAFGRGAREPLQALLGHSLGRVAVFVFFAISGFLVARSFERQPTPGSWLQARALRLLPALAVVLVLTAAVLGPLVTALPADRYFGHPDTLAYVPRNLSLALPQYRLPGVFADNAYRGTVNGSLWTLFYEAVCYGGVLALGLAGAFRHRRRAALGLAALAVTSVAAGQLLPPGPADDKLGRLLPLALPFAIGTAFYVWRDRLVLHPVGLAALAALAVLGRDGPLAGLLFALALAYGVFLLAYLPGRLVRRYNRLGDYSYGTYLYAFPVQQLAVHLFGPLGPGALVALALPATLVLAALSWRWIERPALALAQAPARRSATAGRG